MNIHSANLRISRISEFCCCVSVCSCVPGTAKGTVCFFFLIEMCMTTCISSREDIKVDLNLKTADVLIPESISFTPGQFFSHYSARLQQQQQK